MEYDKIQSKHLIDIASSNINEIEKVIEDRILSQKSRTKNFEDIIEEIITLRILEISAAEWREQRDNLIEQLKCASDISEISAMILLRALRLKNYDRYNSLENSIASC